MRGKQFINKPKVSISYADALEKFVKECRIKNLRPATIGTYKIFIQDFLDFLDRKNKTLIAEINRDTINDYIIYLWEEENIKPVTVVTKVRHVRAFVYFLMREGDIQIPFKVSLPKADEVFKEPYTDSELAELLKQPTTNNFVEWRTWALIAFLIGTGCRISTALNVKISDVNFEERSISFTHLKNRHVQIIPLSSGLANILKTYLSLWDYSNEDFLFNNTYETGGIAVSTAQQEVKRYNLGRGVSKTSCHLFRHTFSKKYIMNGGGVFQLQRLLGHADITTTRHYVQLYNSDLVKGYNELCPLDNIYKGA